MGVPCVGSGVLGEVHSRAASTHATPPKIKELTAKPTVGACTSITLAASLSVPGLLHFIVQKSVQAETKSNYPDTHNMTSRWQLAVNRGSRAKNQTFVEHVLDLLPGKPGRSCCTRCMCFVLVHRSGQESVWRGTRESYQ